MRRRSGFGWLELIIGILLILLGVLAFSRPGLALTGMAIAYGAAAVVMGVADIVLYIQVERFTGFGPVVSLISGILSVMCGMMLLIYPGAGALVLTLLLPIWFIAHCISRLSHLFDIRLIAGNGMYYFTLIANCLGIVLGILMLLSPLFSLTTISRLAGVCLILLGVDGVFTAASRMGMRR